MNLVRATTASFAAAAGGAECLTVLPHDAALGSRSERGRRLARNVAHLLRDESHLAAVADPAGGAWYAEERTALLAEAAWGAVPGDRGGGRDGGRAAGRLAGRRARRGRRGAPRTPGRR